ncbi:unnamed protein product [Microthlaspi erraticum]|uniref:F-box domain-containing protein n=1 Tax=Microthlaspi erraticum TaxID=1685480 RepID=A0A6D2HLL7_9BRAS|nr:unnamed protein product [Microthlaspi erraticum]
MHGREILGSSQASHHHQTSFAHRRIGWCEIGYYFHFSESSSAFAFGLLLLLLLHASLISLSRAEAAMIRTLGFSNYSVSAMKNQRPNVSETEDLLAVFQRNTRSKTSTDGGEYSEPIPVDLLVDIFLRLPLKSIATSRCVSKLWASVLRLPYFTELFLTRPCALPRLLFSCLKDRHVHFFSSPEPQCLDKFSSPLTATYLMKIPYTSLRERIIRCIRGLVFFIDERNVNGKKHQVSVICNPSTRQTLTLPKVKSRRRIGVRSYFGYDPIDKQHKVLAMTWKFCGYPWSVSEEHQVLTLGTNKPSWKKIECCIPHSPLYEYHNICINGVLYYQAVNKSSGEFIIVCFDVKSEKFSFVKDTDAKYGCGALINYKGKLGSLLFRRCRKDADYGSIKLRLLEDAEKHEWSEHIFVLPASWQNIFQDTRLHVVKVTQTNEIVLARSSCDVLYYNTETNTIRKVAIHGMEEAFKNDTGIVYASGDHVEDVKLI